MRISDWMSDVCSSDLRDQQGRPGPGATFLPRPLAAELALERFATKYRVDDEARIALHHDPPQRRDEEGERRQHRIAEDERDRCKRRRNDEQRHRPRLHQRERQIYTRRTAE